MAGGVSASDKNELRRLAMVGGRVSLRTGSLVVFNPIIGLNALYIPGSILTPRHLIAIAAHIGLRIQQPVKGFYFDASLGGYGGVTFDPGKATKGTGGLGAALGAGWRWRRFELGVQARGLLPLTGNDRSRILILGVAGLRF